jgi:hypothetical protein
VRRASPDEVRVMQFSGEITKMPVPCVTGWVLTDGSPSNLGPIIIMDHVKRTSLATLIKQHVKSEEDDVVLQDDIDETTLDYIYEQVAGFPLPRV